MAIDDLADLLLQATGKIEFYWNFYVVLMLALIGWLASTKETFTRSIKWLITIGYLLFVAMNVLGLHGAYEFAEAIRGDLLAMPESKSLTHTYAVLERSSFVTQHRAMFWIHGTMAIVVISAIWRGSFGRPRTDPNESD